MHAFRNSPPNFTRLIGVFRKPPQTAPASAPRSCAPSAPPAPAAPPATRPAPPARTGSHGQTSKQTSHRKSGRRSPPAAPRNYPFSMVEMRHTAAHPPRPAPRTPASGTHRDTACTCRTTTPRLQNRSPAAAPAHPAKIPAGLKSSPKNSQFPCCREISIAFFPINPSPAFAAHPCSSTGPVST